MNQESNKMKQIYKFWVLEFGRDCDGFYTRGSVYPFSNYEEAEACLIESVESSDGMDYRLTDSASDLLEYCGEYHLDCEQYINI